MASLADLEKLVRQAAAALQSGNNAEAKRLLEIVTARSRGNIQIWLMLAHACRGLGDLAGMEAAADRALATEPANIRALILKGDARRAAGEERAATRFHSRALEVAEGANLPPDLAAEVRRTREAASGASKRYRSYLEGALQDADVARSPRFEHALGILFGERKIYQQQPQLFYFPEMPQRQFYERDEFAWSAEVEAATPEILAELNGLLEDREGFRPYLVSDANMPRREFHGLHDNPDWSTLHLYSEGAAVEAYAARAPRTFALINSLPLCRITTRAPTIMFSLLKARARIPAHTGQINTRLICHLPLIVPPNCGFRVGNEVRQWEPGKLLIFDDTIEHEAWNDSDQDRVVLIFDVWRPEIDEVDRRAVSAMFAAIDAYR